MHARSPVLTLVAVCGLVRAQINRGIDTCRCLSTIYEEPNIELYRRNGDLIYTPSGSTQEFVFPTTYGQDKCDRHDENLAPYCQDEHERPGWCTAQWCYVDSAACTAVSKFKSKYFAKTGLEYSYGTCAAGGESTSTISSMTDQDVQKAKRTIEVLEGYIRAARWQIEDSFVNYNDSTTCNTAAYGMCPCEDCYQSSYWNGKMSFMEVGFLGPASGSEQELEQAKCMWEGVAANFQRTAAVEGDSDFTRVGYMYFADQATGSYSQWPREEMCIEGGYDPRMRPWYAMGSTGPKDVVIVVDVSGSMMQENRHVLAKDAVLAILDTVTWKDFIAIILFNNGVSSVFAPEGRMVPGTEKNIASAKTWCGLQSWAGGGTNFLVPLQHAFGIIADSVADGRSSMCQKAILFLTDGEAEFSTDDFGDVQSQANRFDVNIFTYALGSGADVTITKKLACQNRGVFYPVPDGGDLGHIMSSYFEFYAHGQELCSASFVKFTSNTGGQTLFTGCMPFSNRATPEAALLGVSCMDLNVLGDLPEETPGWSPDYLSCATSDMTKICRQVDLTDCHMQKIRLAYSAESVCDEPGWDEFKDVTESTVCPCTDQSCMDDLNFIDEQDYFCDTWVGDDCYEPDPSWGYSEDGLRDVREKCPRSCGLCPWTSGECKRTSSLECPVIPVADACRACVVGKTSGVDINDHPMRCPADGPPDDLGHDDEPHDTGEYGHPHEEDKHGEDSANVRHKLCALTALLLVIGGAA